MNKLIFKFLLPLSLLNLVGCSKQNPTPSHDTINSVSPKHETKQSGYMQNILDSFLKDDWTPTLSKNKDIQKKYMKEKIDKQSKEKNYEDDKERNFTLQEYVDKITAYSNAKPNNYQESHYKKLETLPAIGK